MLRSEMPWVVGLAESEVVRRNSEAPGTLSSAWSSRGVAFSSSGAPLQWVKDSGAMDAVYTLFDEYLAQICGLTSLDHVHVGGLVPGSSADFVHARLGDVEKTVNRHFGP